MPIDALIDWFVANYGAGFQLALYEAIGITIDNIFWVLAGVLIGMAIGILPGLGGTVTVALLLPLTITMDQYQAFAFLSGSIGAINFSASMTAILANTPGTVASAATMLDGNPLTQKGEAGRAISVSAISSATGGGVGLVLFILLIPIIIQFALLFGPAEISWLVIAAFASIPFIVGDRPLLGAATALFAGLLSLIGRSPRTGEIRFTFGNNYLEGGLELIPVLIGLFVFAEMIRLFASSSSKLADASAATGSRLVGFTDIYKHKMLWLKSSIIGWFTGVIPGMGASAATFLAYSYAVQSSNDGDEFGSGRIEGVIAPESANDAKDAGQLVPTLGLGIPGSGTMAIFLGGLIMHGIVPSPHLMEDNLVLVMVIALSFLVSNILTSVIGLAVQDILTKVLDIPVNIIFPFLLLIAVASTFIVRNQMFDVFIALLFGLLGVIMIYINVSRVPFIIGFILGIILETNLHQALAFSDGGILNALFGSTISIILAAFVLVFLLYQSPLPSLLSSIFGSDKTT